MEQRFARPSLVNRAKNAQGIYITSSDDQRPFRATPSRIYVRTVHPRFYQLFFVACQFLANFSITQRARVHTVFPCS